MGESKQVKVDNWGIFFLQRLQTFFNKTYFCDLTLQFEDNVQLKVHRLVLNACTDYFQVLEQTCDLVNDCLIMPPDLQADIVVPIVNFMYTGILEFQTSIFDRLYSTARLMNMTVLTKLLDAQKVPILPISKPINKRNSITPITWNLQGKKITPKTMDPDLPEPLPGRKLPIWKRRSAPISHLSSTASYSTGILQAVPDPLSTKYFRSHQDESPKPTRFEWPEDDENFDTNSFDEISYTSKTIAVPVREKSPKPSTSNFDEIKRSSVKRAASPLYNDSKRVNIQDVKEYTKEQKIRSDYNEYDDSEAADNDLQTFDDNNDSEDDNQISEETKSILKSDATVGAHNKRVRFSLVEGKENSKMSGIQPTGTLKANVNSSEDVSNHTKIITEVLKKFPQLVQKNKNIRLKILAKGQNSNIGIKSSGMPIKVVKPVSKISYMVSKPPETVANQDKKDGHWSCQKCSEPNPLQFETYHSYRQHLTEMHNEKIDSQMCNLCGHVSRKQNMLMYHKYVKHNIEPPPIFQFPKCKECPYIALSPSLLIKHQYNHSHQNLLCGECSTTFQNKSELIRHIQITGHSGQTTNIKTYDCNNCTKKFISDDTLQQHIRNNHKEVLKENNEGDKEDAAKKENIITAEEIDAMEEQGDAKTKQIEQIYVQQKVLTAGKTKEKKIKILSDIKVNNPISTNCLLPVNKPVSIAENTVKIEGTQIESQQLEPSSEAESLSNVASGIAASLGLVNTIVVLDENNQFILQDGSQTANTQQNFILPDGTNLQNLHVTQHQVITTGNNSIITQAELNKNNIGSTDELVMVLTDHDYGDATNNSVLTSDNSNIVVLYSHPVQGEDAQFLSEQANLMLNSSMGLVEVTNNYPVSNQGAKQCEESIEMIEHEINNHLNSAIPIQLEKSTDPNIPYENNKPQTESVQQETVILQQEQQDISVSVENTIVEANATEFSEKMEIDDPFETSLSKEDSDLLNTPVEIVLDKEQIESENQAVPKENVPEIQDEENKLEATVTTSVLDQESVSEEQFEEPMEVEESVEMIQQTITSSTEEDNTGESTAVDICSDTEVLIPRSEDIPGNIFEPRHEEGSDKQGENKKLTTIVEAEEGEDSKTTETDEKNEEHHVIKENIQKEMEKARQVENENVEKEQEDVEEIEYMEVDSAKHAVNKERINASQHSEQNISTVKIIETNTDNSEEAIRTSEINSQSCESTDIVQETVDHIHITQLNVPSNQNEIENLSENTQANEIINNGIDTSTNSDQPSQTCAEMSEIGEAETESLCQTLDEVSDLPQDTTSSETSESNYPASNQAQIIENINNSYVDNDQQIQHQNALEESQQSSSSISELRTLDTDTSKTCLDSIEKDSEQVEVENITNINNTELVEETAEVNSVELQQTENNLETEIRSNENVEIEYTNKSINTDSVSDIKNNSTELCPITNPKISNLLDDWDDGDTDSQQSDSTKHVNPPKKVIIDNRSSINTLINDWEDEED